MAGKQWIMGCGIGCLVVVVALVIGGGIMVSKVKDTVAEFENVGESQEQLRELYGDISDYVPPADGRIDPDRIEVFLRVQQQVHGAGGELEVALAGIRTMEEGGNFSLGKLRAAVQGIGALGTSLGRYFNARNNALLEHEMGFGEFTYLMSLVYYGWLSEPLVLTLDGDEDGDEHRRWSRIAEMFEGLLERQREAAEAAGDPEGIVAALTDQLAELALDDEWVPWSEGSLPDVTVDSLSPYRGRFEGLYTDAGVLLGVGASSGDGGFDFEVQ